MHLSEELSKSSDYVEVTSQHGAVRGRRSVNGATAFLEISFALPPQRFADPEALPAGYQYPENVEYIYESKYAVQPDNDGQAKDTLPIDKLGLGKPTENPLFLNIVCPPSFPKKTGFPVRVYIHGGFLQFGSPHNLSAQAQYVSEEREEVWVNIGYRLSVFGFIAADQPPLTGNYGFKDQWLGLEWIRDNISAFGGDPNNIILTGSSAGAHSCHQLLHYASRLPEGRMAPFQGVILQSNAIVNDPKTPSELQEQYSAVVTALKLNPEDPDILETLQDTSKVPWQSLTAIAEELVPHGTFRGCTDGKWMTPGAMEYQASPRFVNSLREKGIQFVVTGDMRDEWYLYSIAHPITDYASIGLNLKRYYPDDVVERILNYYGRPEKEPTVEENTKLFGVMLSEGQVYLPVRLLHRDLAKHGFPVIRYQMKWSPEERRPLGYITHGCDRPIWTFRHDMLVNDLQVDTVRRWLDTIDEYINEIRTKGWDRDVKQVLTLSEDTSIRWENDERWDEMIKLASVLPNEPRD